MLSKEWSKFKSGSDIRGTAAEGVPGAPVDLLLPLGAGGPAPPVSGVHRERGQPAPQRPSPASGISHRPDPGNCLRLGRH